MKFSMYLSYTSRSLLRGGQRTILAVFCVAVGVMAVVSLQLVGFMLQSSLTGNVRASLGGDIAVTTTGLPLQTSDLAFFMQLKNAGTITNYTATMNATGALNPTATSLQSFTVEAVDPNNFPLVEQPDVVQPKNNTLASLLMKNQVVVTQDFLDKYQKQVGAPLNVYVKTNQGSGQTLAVKIAGVIANSGMFAQSGNLLLISTQNYLATAPTNLTNYSTVDVTTLDQTHTSNAVKAINAQFPLVSTQTVADVIKSEQASIDLITKFLEISGLLALLIGGVGIVNTMQVLLSRRKTEIAMLKTTGYHRKDLYLLFGLEASLLGLIGGIAGSLAAIGVSSIVRNLMQGVGFTVPFLLSPWIIASGVIIGCATALIFGLMPIVQAANVRPLSVIREQETWRASSTFMTILLLIILSALFCLLATVILNNDLILGIKATYGTFAFLLVLSAIFGLIVLAISKLPVPEHLQIKQVLLVVFALAASALVYLVLPVFGIFLLTTSLFGIVVTLLPRTWKVSLKMALRNIGRQRTRVTTTILALFIGIFGIALVVGLGQGLQTQISSSLSQNEPYNVVASTSGLDTTTLHAQLHTVPGLTSSNVDPFAQVKPVDINGQSPQKVLPTGDNRQQAASFLSGIEGYNPASSGATLTITQGRNLNASDVNTNNVIISELLAGTGWLHINIKVGDRLTFASLDGKTQKTVTVVGIISRSSSFALMGKIFAPLAVVNALSPTTGGASAIFYLKVDTAQINHALDKLGQIVPDATAQDLTSAATSFIQQLNSILDMLVAIASLSVIAAVIIIANAVALAMLERRRELGILKAVGYTSGTILSEIVIENGIIGGVGAFLATLLASGGIALFSTQIFNVAISMPTMIVLSLIFSAILLAVLVATLVAWGAVRIRPLEVLRYE